MSVAVLPRARAAEHVGLSVSTMEKLVRLGKFPKPRQLSANRSGYLRREIDEWAEALPVSTIPPGPGA